MKSGTTTLPVALNTAGVQYALRFNGPPWQLPPPLLRSDWNVLEALVRVLPKNMCRCEAPGWPG